MSLITKLTPSNYGQAVTFVTTVKPAPPNGELITFYDGSVVIGTNTVSGGSAYLTYSNFSAGSHLITASYAGDATLAPSTSSSVLQTVRRASSSTTLASSLPTISSSGYGQPITLTANVPANIPYGESVSFYDRNVQIGTGVVASGSATLIISTLAAGSHSITAQYMGDSNYNPSTSSALAQTVQPSPSYLALNSSFASGSVTLMATLSSPYNALPPNGETVTFKDGAKVINTTKISSGIATFTSASLSSGIHTITATYQGDSNFVSSTSQVLTLNNQFATGGIGGCGFALNLSSASPYYVVPQKIGIYYTVKSINGCTSPASGTISLSSSATGEVYASIPVNITSIIGTPVTRVIYVNSTGAYEGPNLAIALITAGQMSNLSTTSFQVLHTANLSIENLSLESGNTLQEGSPLYLMTHVVNTAFIDANNATINLRIIAPNQSAYVAKQSIGKIRLFQNLSIIQNPGIGAVPLLPGKYQVSENISFYSNYSTTQHAYSSGKLYSNTASFAYVVQPNKNPQSANPGSYPLPAAQVGPAVLESFPYYTEFMGGAQVNMSNIAFYDSAKYPITINLSASNFTLGSLAFSQNSLSLQPNQQASIGLQFTPYKNINFTTYLLPINVSVSGANLTAGRQLYAIMAPKATGSSQSVFSAVTLFNGSTAANTQLTILNPRNATEYDVSLYTSLNSLLTGSPRNIALAGSLASMSSASGAYNLGWFVGKMAGYNITQLNYNTSNILNPRYLLIPPVALSSTTQSNLSALSILKIILPKTTYTNNTYNITVSAIYTGANTTAINFTLTPTSAAGKVLDPKQSFTVTPDSSVYVSFVVETGPYPENETFTLAVPGISTVSPEYLMLNVALPPVQIPTIYDYINDPRTIFGVLTFSVSAIAILGGKISKWYKERQEKRRMTVKSLAALPRLDKKINMALLNEDGRKRVFRRQKNKDGSLGGFAEESAMVGGDVIIAATALVEGDAIISGNAKILGRARVADHAVIRGEVVLSGAAMAGDNAELYGDARLSENAKAFGECEVYDSAHVFGDAEVFGNAHVFGEAQISGKAKVFGSARVSGVAKVKKAKISKGDIVSGIH
jgi:carbonic anhydrase/acetyltransferase-like protein (isoleucine patch superfamily)